MFARVLQQLLKVLHYSIGNKSEREREIDKKNVFKINKILLNRIH